MMFEEIFSVQLGTHHLHSPPTEIEIGMEIAKDAIATAVATAFSVLVGQPFDTLKVRTQVMRRSGSTLQYVQNILKNDGIISLWRGGTVAFFGQICENTTSFVLNAYFQRLLGPPQSDRKNEGEEKLNEISISRSFFVGSMAGFFTAIIVCPIETIKCKVQVAQASTLDKSHCVRSIIKEIFKSQGIKGLTHGLFPQMARDIPGSAVYFGCYDALYHIFHNTWNMGIQESCLLAGGFAGQIYWITSLPMDRVKSIIQTQRYDCIPGLSASIGTNPPSPSEGLKAAVQLSKILYNLHGIRGFYQGGLFALIRAFPTNASLFYGYKSTRRFLDDNTT